MPDYGFQTYSHQNISPGIGCSAEILQFTVHEAMSALATCQRNGGRTCRLIEKWCVWVPIVELSVRFSGLRIKKTRNSEVFVVGDAQIASYNTKFRIIRFVLSKEY